MEEEKARLQAEYKKLCAEFTDLSICGQNSPGQVSARQHLEKRIEHVVLRLREINLKLKPKEL
jgi:hypothetical protein